MLQFEEAGRRGAAACLIVHNTAAASYPWHVIENGRCVKILLPLRGSTDLAALQRKSGKAILFARK